MLKLLRSAVANGEHNNALPPTSSSSPGRGRRGPDAQARTAGAPGGVLPDPQADLARHDRARALRPRRARGAAPARGSARTPVPASRSADARSECGARALPSPKSPRPKRPEVVEPETVEAVTEADAVGAVDEVAAQSARPPNPKHLPPMKPPSRKREGIVMVKKSTRTGSDSASRPSGSRGGSRPRRNTASS